MRRIFLIVAVITLFRCALPCTGAELFMVHDVDTEVSLRSGMTFYRDPSGSMTLETIRGVEFYPWEAASFGVTSDAIWGRFQVENQLDRAGLWYAILNTSRMDEVDAYVVHNSGGVEHFSGGNLRARSTLAVDDKYPVFPLRLEAGEKVDFFWCIRSETQIRFPVFLSGSLSFAGRESRDDFFFALVFGYLLALIAIALITSVLAGDRGYLIYAAFMGSVFLAFLVSSGYYAWFSLPAGAFMSKTGLILSGHIGIVLLLAYVRHLLDLKQVMPRLDRWVTWLARCVAVVTPLPIWFPFRTVFPLFIWEVVIIQAGLLVLSVAACWHGVRGARFYALAWVVFWVFQCLSLLPWISFQPIHRLPVVYVMLGAVGSGTLFLMAMADRVRGIRLASFEAQGQVLELERQVTRELRSRLHQEKLLIRDLHDGIGGLTANVAILAEVGRRSALSREDELRFEAISELAAAGGVEIRSLMNSLEVRQMRWPDVFEHCNVLGQVLVESHGIDFEFRETGYDTQADPGVFAGLSLLKVVREALNNAVKHSHCTRLLVDCAFSPGKVELRVRDDGQGMGEVREEGRGLGNMRSRIEELGGTMRIRSQEGLELLFQLPLPIPDLLGTGEA